MNKQIEIWYNALIDTEIKEIDKDIRNEKIWSLSDLDDSFHDDNLKNLYEYKDYLKSQKFSEERKMGFVLS